MSETCKSTCCKDCGNTVCKAIAKCSRVGLVECPADASPCEDWVKREESTEVLLRQSTERNGNLNVQLAAMTAERDALRREVEEQRKVIRLMSIRCAMYCSADEHCPKQPVNGKFDMETCYQCQTEKYAKQAAQAGKVEQ